MENPLGRLIRGEFCVQISMHYAWLLCACSETNRDEFCVQIIALSMHVCFFLPFSHLSLNVYMTLVCMQCTMYTSLFTINHNRML